MTTLFKAPQIGEPRSVGEKNGGVTSYDTTCAEVSTMMVMVTTRLDPAPEARISLCMCMTPLGNACMH